MKRAIVLVLFSVVLGGCAQLSGVINVGVETRDKIAQAEMEAARSRLCKSDFDKIVREFGQTSVQWEALLRTCNVTLSPLSTPLSVK